ncbi:hypothetical protein [Singulisphaera sp. PoT]|uniref:hypothetical protein n=1 Tax=Singulisphaera sp. PoT TaxID=3411797 RepID=UPI003BF5C8B0
MREALEKLEGKTAAYAAAYDHPGCHRTSDAVDRPMNRLCRLIYAGRGLHGHQGSSERRLRGWALLQNFRPYAPRGRCLVLSTARPIGSTASVIMNTGRTT